MKVRCVLGLYYLFLKVSHTQVCISKHRYKTSTLRELVVKISTQVAPLQYYVGSIGEIMNLIDAK